VRARYPLSVMRGLSPEPSETVSGCSDGKTGGRLVVRVDASDGGDQGRIAAAIEQECHVPADREGGDVRIVQDREQRHAQRLEIEHAQDVDVQLHERFVLLRQRHADRPDQHEAQRQRTLEDEAELDVDQRRRAPAEQRHWAEYEAARGGREDRADVGEDLVGVHDRVVREQNLVERSRAQPGLDRVDGDRSVHRRQAASAVQREAVSELDGRKRGGDDDQERKTRRPVGQLRVEQADRGQSDLRDAELQDAGVAAGGGVVGEEASARDQAAVERDAEAGRRLEPGEDVERAGVPGGESRGQLHPDPGDREPERPERAMDPDVGARGQRGRAAGRQAGEHGEVDGVDSDRPELEVGRHRHLESGAARERETALVAPADAELDRDREIVAREQAAEERILVAEGEHGLETVHLGRELQLQLALREREAEARLGTLELNAAGAGAAEQHRGRGRVVVEREAEPGGRRLRAGRERVTDQHLARPHDDPERAGDVAAGADLELEIVGERQLLGQRARHRRPQREAGQLPLVGGKLDDDDVDRQHGVLDHRARDRDPELPAHRFREGLAGHLKPSRKTRVVRVAQAIDARGDLKRDADIMQVVDDAFDVEVDGAPPVHPLRQRQRIGDDRGNLIEVEPLLHERWPVARRARGRDCDDARHPAPGPDVW
jgi:hypothetical protein